MFDAGSGRALVAVLGYHGTEASHHALEWLAESMVARPLTLVHAVYVKSSSEADSDEGLAVEVQHRLFHTTVDWRFEERTGEVAEELLRVAREDAATGALVVLVLGRPVADVAEGDSVLRRLARSSPFPLVVVPPPGLS
jgi:nucleotide-binding universal stress UspA family protein